MRIKAAIDAKDLHIVKVTPLVLLSRSVQIYGNTCTWIEAKNNFGSRLSPFVAGRNKKRFHKYASTFSPGILVFKLGYETDLRKSTVFIACEKATSFPRRLVRQLEIRV